MRLTPAQAERLVLLAQAGDEGAAAKLMHACRRVVMLYAMRYFAPGTDREDVIAVGQIGLWEAICGWRPDRGCSFATFADTCIRRECISFAKAGNTPSRQFTVSATPISHLWAQWDGTDWEAPAPRYDDPAVALEARDTALQLLQTLRNTLPPYQWQVLRLFLAGQSYAAIAERLREEYPHRGAKSVDNALCRIRRRIPGMVGQLADWRA